MDAHRTGQGTAAISGTMWGVCGADVATHSCICNLTKLLKRDQKPSLAKRETRAFENPVTCRQCWRNGIGYQRYETQYDTGSGDRLDSAASI